MSKQEKIQKLRMFIREQGACIVKDVMNEFMVTRSTAFGYLRNEHFLTSVNHKGQYHIERTMINFNKYGLCNKNGMIFSKYGNLLQTVIALISNSPEGMRASEVSRLVGTNAYTQCQTLCRNKLIFRKKEGRGYCYFSSDVTVRKQQQSEKEAIVPFDINSELKNESTESLHEIIKILVTYARNPSYSPKNVALSLTRNGIRITTEKVKLIFEQYDIAKKNS